MTTNTEATNTGSPSPAGVIVNNAQLRRELTPQKLYPQGVLWPAEVDRICAEETRTQFLIEGFLPAGSIAIAAGESTVGKTSLFYQLGVCVAAGAPFLGMSTRQGRVLYLDLENSLHDSRAMRDALVDFLKLDSVPKDFLLMTEPPKDLGRLIGEVLPNLIIVDSLRAYRPEVTEKNRPAAEWIKEIRRLARTYGCAFLIIHHFRKPNREVRLPDLEDSNVVTCLLEMEGPRALVNQTDVRIAIAEGDHNPAALKLKWSRRVHGDSALVLLERVLDGDDEPAGYRQLTGADFLNPGRRLALAKLPSAPAEFSFKDAQIALNRSPDPTNKALKEWMQLGLVVKVRKGRYQKVLHDSPARCETDLSVLEAPAVE